MITEHNTNIFLGSSLESVFQSRVSHKSACQRSFLLSTLIADVSITMTQDISERSVRVLNQHLLCARTSSVPVLHGFSLRRQENLQGTPKTAFGSTAKGCDEDTKSNWCKWKQYIYYIQYYLQYMNLPFLSEFVVPAGGRVWPPPPGAHTECGQNRSSGFPELARF